MVNEEQGLQVEGVLGPKLRIKPSGMQGRSYGSDVPHILYEVQEENGVFSGVGTPMNETFDITERQNADNQIPTTIRPEMLLAVDSSFRAQFKSNETLLMYLIITFNAVNVRYLTVSAPRVKLKFCALEIFTATTEIFLERTGNYVLGIPTLQKIKEYVRSHEEKYREYDGVYLVTGLDMAEYSYYGWNFGLMGYAYVGGICGELKVGYGEDSVGTFKGVRIFAHEAAHLLGCPHDGTSSGSYTSVNCPWNDGFIMSYKEVDSRSMKFSQCCNQMITQMVWSQKGICLRTRITKIKINKKRFTSLLPGNVLTRDKICEMTFPQIRGTRFMADEHGNENCVARCFIPKEVYGYNTSLNAFLPDNSRCKENGGSRCRNGDCVKKRLKRRAYKPY
uniref:Reprolysin n=1 Tax=Rhipicephalus appendiculatus TaxID=34631 RepID=A0A131Z5G2_RHIAP